MREKDELKGTRSNFIPWLRVFEYQGKNCLGVVKGLSKTPVRIVTVGLAINQSDREYALSNQSEICSWRHKLLR